MPRNPPQERLEAGEYERVLAEQGGGCALCGAEPKARRLDEDHRHKTGRFRGLLCGRCNRALGLVERYGFGPEWLTYAAGYCQSVYRDHGAWTLKADGR